MTAAITTFGYVSALERPVPALRNVGRYGRALIALLGSAALLAGLGLAATLLAAWISSSTLSGHNRPSIAGGHVAIGMRSPVLALTERVPPSGWSGASSDHTLQANIARAQVLNGELARYAPAPARPVETMAAVPLPPIARRPAKAEPVTTFNEPAAEPITTASIPTRLPDQNIGVPLPQTYPNRRDAQPAPAVAPAPQVAALTTPPLSSAPKLASLPPQRGKSFSLPEVDSRTAVYDISARTVYLPNGKRLEAHSGYGEKIDDPRYVHVKMRGATPPNVYTLTEREKLFHGVRAIRLNPVDEGKMNGRDGILAHSYLLGPSGQSHGCVSFKDYDKFLQAFLDGQIDRMVVVRHSDELPPSSVARNGQRNSSNLFAAVERQNHVGE